MAERKRYRQLFPDELIGEDLVDPDLLVVDKVELKLLRLSKMNLDGWLDIADDKDGRFIILREENNDAGHENENSIMCED